MFRGRRWAGQRIEPGWRQANALRGRRVERRRVCDDIAFVCDVFQQGIVLPRGGEFLSDDDLPELLLERTIRVVDSSLRVLLNPF